MFHHQYYLNPLSFNPVLWIDFADASTVTTSGGNITNLIDKSPSGLSFSQGIAAERPAYITAGLNGLNLARFDGINDQLVGAFSSNLLRNVSGSTIYVVRALSAPAVTGRVAFLILTSTSVVRATIRLNVSSMSGISGRVLDGDAQSNQNGTTVCAPGVYGVQAGVFDYANNSMSVYLDGIVDGTDPSFGTATVTSNTVSAGSAIGSSYGILYFNGDICEILVFHTAHNNATRYAITQYLRTKWGI